VADNVSGIPPIIRDAFPDDRPPDPPEIEPERDDDDRHGHHWIAVPLPVFAIYSDGTRVGNGWTGHLLDAWLHLATFVTVGLGVWVAWSSVSSVVVATTLVLWLMSLGVILIALVVWALVIRTQGWWRRRRKASAS
jgi:hypothetical protein